MTCANNGSISGNEFRAGANFQTTGSSSGSTWISQRAPAPAPLKKSDSGSPALKPCFPAPEVISPALREGKWWWEPAYCYFTAQAPQLRGASRHKLTNVLPSRSDFVVTNDMCERRESDYSCVQAATPFRWTTVRIFVIKICLTFQTFRNSSVEWDINWISKAGWVSDFELIACNLSRVESLKSYSLT